MGTSKDSVVTAESRTWLTVDHRIHGDSRRGVSVIIDAAGGPQSSCPRRRAFSSRNTRTSIERTTPYGSLTACKRRDHCELGLVELAWHVAEFGEHFMLSRLFLPIVAGHEIRPMK